MNGPGGIGGAGGALGGWRLWLGLGGAVALLGGGMWALTQMGGPPPPPPPKPVSRGGGASDMPSLPPPRPAPAPQPAFAPVQSVAMPAPPRPAARRPRPSEMVLYDDPTPLRPAPRTAAAKPEDPNGGKVAGMEVMRAEVLHEPEWWMMPGDKIPCGNIEPLTARTGAKFSMMVNEDVRGRTGGRTLLPKGSRVVGTVAKTMEHGDTRLVAVIEHAEGPSVPGRPTVVVPLKSQAADVIGQVDMEGNVDSGFGRRLAAVSAYAALDMVSNIGGVLAGAAIADAVTGGEGGVGVGFYGLRGAGRTLGAQEYQRQMRVPPQFQRPQGQACTVFIQHPIDFRVMKHAQR